MQTEENENENQGIWAVETFKYENTRSDFVAITRKTKDPRGILACIDGFTDEPVVQCDVQVVIW